MRILKYLFLLLLLSLVASSIFVATQKGEFIVEKSKIINSPKSTVFNYVNDYKNWENFASWMVEDPQIKTFYPKNTVGKGGSYSWEDKEGSGDLKTLFVKENENISQQMNYKGTTSDVFWSFKDTLGGTKVTWRTKGKMSFLLKISAAFSGGAETIISKTYEKSLDALDKILDFETNTYTVKVNGLVRKTETFYLKQTFTSKISDITRNTRVVFPKIITFCKQNNIVMNGKPFLIYHTYDTTKGIAKLSFCIPIKEAIYTSEGSDILSGKLKSFTAIKTTLTGDYSHSQKALDKTLDYFTTNHLVPDPAFSHLEIYSIGKSEGQNPSKWVTIIYYPLKPKTVAAKPRIIAADSIYEPPTSDEEK